MDKSPSRLIVTDDQAYPPFVFLDQSGAPRGIMVDLYELWSRKTGIPVEFRLMDWEMALKAVQEGRADVVSGMFKTPERESLFDYSKKILNISTAIFFHKQIAGIKGIEDLSGFRVGVVRGDSAEEWMQSSEREIGMVRYSGVDAMVRDAIAGRIKVFMADVPVARFFLAQFPSGENFRQSADIYSNSLFPGIRKGDRQVLAVVKAGFDKISSSEIDAIVDQWAGTPAVTAFPWRMIELAALAIVSLSVAVFLWNLSLRRRVTAAIHDLTEKNRQLLQSNEALKLSEKKFRLIFENAPYAITINRLPDGKFLDANKVYLENRGIRREELAHLAEKSGSALNMTEEDRKAVVETLMRNGVVRNAEAKVRRANNSIGHIFYSSVLLEVDGEPQALSIVVDVTEKVEAQEALRKSEEKFRTIFHNAPIGIFRTSYDGIILEANATLARMLGYANRDELLSSVTNISTEVYPTPEKRQQFLSALTENPKGVRMEVEFRCRDGSPLYAVVNASMQMDTDDRPAFLDGTIEDITDLKRAEMELRRLAAAVEQSGEIIVITDPNGAIQYVNQAFEQITGYTRLEAIGRKPSLLKSGEHDRSFYSDLWKQISNGRIWKGRLVNRHKDGSLFTEDATISPVIDDTGTIINYVAAKRDITKQLALEAQNLQMQKMEAIGHLAGGIAHDFNNILSAVIGYSEIALDAELSLDDPARDSVENILKAGLRAKDLVRQILTFSRQTQYEKKPISLVPIVKEVVKLMRASLPANIEIRQDLPNISSNILGDPIQIHQVLMNLCTNAGYAMQNNGGVLEIVLSKTKISLSENKSQSNIKPGSYVALSVADTGPGIPASVLKQIFDPFFTTKPKEEGTGLGLSVVHGIVTDHGGVIEVASTPGEGTTFTVCLPLIKDNETQAIVSDAPLPSGTERILVVDDEQEISGALEKILQGLGYRVTTTSSSRAALNRFEENPTAFDLVITDQTMPGINGDQLSLKMLALRPDIPIILCTGFSHIVDEARAKAMGIQGFILKPVVRRDLAATVRHILDQRRNNNNGKDTDHR